MLHHRTLKLELLECFHHGLSLTHDMLHISNGLVVIFVKDVELNDEVLARFNLMLLSSLPDSIKNSSFERSGKNYDAGQSKFSN